MRIVPVIGLLAGCNWVFGLADTSPAVPDGGTAPTHVLLTRQVLTTPGMPPDLFPIGSTQFTVSRLDQPTELSMVAVDAHGGFDLPVGVLGQPYRIIYQLPEDNVPREIVWSQGTHYVVPMFGRSDRGSPPTIPSAPVISYMATGGVPGFFDPFVFTTGLWSRVGLGAPGGSRPNPVVDDYLTSTPLGGPLGALASTDTVWLIDYECPDPPSALCMANRGLPNRAIGFAKTSLAMMGGSNAISAVWHTTNTIANPHMTFDDQSMRDRITKNVMGHLDTTGSTNTLLTTGVIPSISMPASTQLREDGGLADPVMIPLSNSTDGNVVDGGGAPLSPVDPFVDADELPLAVIGNWSNSRIFDGTQLTSGYIQVQPPAMTDPTVIEPCADMASEVTIHDPATVVDPVALGTDGVMLPFSGTSPQIEVTFVLADIEKPLTCKTKNIVTQACAVTVFEFDGSGKLRTKRVVDTVVTSAMMTVEIDSSAFELGHDFVLGIVCRSGYEPGAFAQGRFDAIEYPFSTSTHYPAAFTTVVPPKM